MKKHLIAAAVAAAVAVPAMAQNVTISGTLDVRAINDAKETYGTTTRKWEGTDGNTTSANNAVDGFATSQIVVAGTEDLGGGLRAGFSFVQRLGTGLEARDRALFLSGGFGEVRVGRFNPSVTAQFLGLSGLASTGNAGSFYAFATSGGGFGVGSSGTTAGSWGTGVNHERDNGTIQYTSPRFNNIVATLGYRGNTTDANTSNATKTEVEQTYGTLVYTAGKITAGAGYSKRDSFGNFPGSINTYSTTTSVATAIADSTDKLSNKLTWLAGGYDFGVARVNVALAKAKADLAGATRNDASLQSVSVTVPLGAITLSGSLYEGDDDGAAAATDNIDTSGYQLSARYALSKRTFAYLITGENKTEKTGANVTADADRKLKQTAIGIVHNF